MPTQDVTTARDDFETILSRVVEGKERVLLTQEGRPVAAVVPLEDYHKIEPDPAWQERFEQFLTEIRSRIPVDISSEEVEADITAASEEVRQERLARRC